MLLRPFLRRLTPLLVLAAVAGCSCESQTCDCFSENEDLITLRFDTDSLTTGFRKAEIRSAYVVRYTAAGFAVPLDTVRQRPEQEGQPDFYEYYGAFITLNYLFSPRPDAPGSRLPDYNYRVVVPAANKQYSITEVRLAGETRGNRCCACYRNTQKSLRLDGVYLAAESSDRQLPAILRR